MEDAVNGVGVESPDVIAANWKKKVKEESVDMRNSKQDSRNDSNTMIESLEDLQELAGTSGRWNLTVIVLACLCTFVSPFQAISYQFLGATPNYWCHVVPLVDANWTNEEILDFAIPSSGERNTSDEWSSCQMYDFNYTLAVELGYQKSVNNHQMFPKIDALITTCPSRDFNHTHYQSTIVTKWDLVCNRRALYSTTQAMVSVGNFLGYLLFGCLIEMIGRRRSVLLSGALSFVTGMVTALSPTLAFYMVMRILVAASCSGYYSGCLIICFEICSPKHRSIIGSLYAIPWAVGYMVLPGVAYLVRDWQMLQVALTIPNIFFVIYIWTLPESPRWLVINGKKEEALKVLTKAASVNGKTLPPEQEMLAAMDRIKQKCLNMKEEPREELGLWRQVVARVQWFVAPIRLPHLRKIALPVFFCWFTCAMVYYGVSFSATNLSANPYIYMFLGGLLEIPSYLILCPMSIYLGRKKSMVLLYLVCAASILLLMTLQLLLPDAPVVMTEFFSLCGKVASTAAYSLIWYYTAELCPTQYRSIILGMASMCSVFGSVSSPYINDLLGEVKVWSPSALFGSVSLLSTGLAFFLPETVDIELPESVDYFAKKPKTPSDNSTEGNTLPLES